MILSGILLTICLVVPASATTDLDDSLLFMDAFNAFQRKDYLLSIEKLGQLNQLFPESPLRDVSLLMLARSNYRSGEYDAAARAINQFTAEFANSTLAGSVEEELLTVGKRQKSGEKLLTNRALRLAAQKVRNEQLAIERAKIEKAERERLAQEKAERDRIAREKAETERKERERLAAIKADRDSIKVSVLITAIPQVEAGQSAIIPLEISNHSPKNESFSVSHDLPAEYNASLTTENNIELKEITIPSKGAVRAILTLKMPAEKVDGFKTTQLVKVISKRYPDITETGETHLVAAAPLLRGVVKLNKPAVAPGETVAYRINILNVGTVAAKEVDLRITLPPQLQLVDAGANGCWLETEQLAACRIAKIDSGNISERTLKVKVRESATGQNLRGTLEVIQTVLQTKESFQGAGFNITKNP